MKASFRRSQDSRMIQFSTYSATLRDQIDSDVSKSEFKTKTMYFNSLMKRVLGLKKRLGSKSCIEELCKILDLVEVLPLEAFRELADEHDRNWTQILLQLVHEALYRAKDRSECALSFDDFIER